MKRCGTRFHPLVSFLQLFMNKILPLLSFLFFLLFPFLLQFYVGERSSAGRITAGKREDSFNKPNFLLFAPRSDWKDT